SAVHSRAVAWLVLQRAADSLADWAAHRSRNELTKAGLLGPAVGTWVRPRQLQCGRVDPVGTHENLSRGSSTIRKGRCLLAGGLTQLCQPAVHVYGDRRRRPAVGTELEHPLI